MIKQFKYSSIRHTIKLAFLFLLVCSFCTSLAAQSPSLSGGESRFWSAETQGPERGTLLIIGGNASDFFYEKFMELVGGPEAPIVVIPTAISSDSLSTEDLENFKKSFEKRGFNHVTVFHTRDRKLSNTPGFVAVIHQARGIWFSGGRQWRHADSYLHTLAHQAFFEVLNRGGVIAGSSAGATIQGSYLARGDTGGNTLMTGDHEEGLGFIQNIAIDQHLFARNRQFDMFEILDQYPGLLGLGLDEDTGILVKGDTCRVIGRSYVAVYDGTRWSAERDTIYQLPEGSQQFYLLREGDRYDLNKRQVILD